MQVRWVILFSLWLTLIVAGMASLAAYSTSPGEAISTPTQWPQASTLRRPDGQMTMLVFLHPHCPCSRATVSELACAMKTNTTDLSVVVLAYCPQQQHDDWANTNLIQAALQAANATIQLDRSGREAKIFGATTSGQILIYSPQGTLLYSGGITSSRGHEGDNLPKQALQKVLQGERLTNNRYPVFGCPIFSSN